MAAVLPKSAFAPRYWPAWLGIGLLRLLVFLPYRVQMALGRGLGRFSRFFATRARHIAAVNLRLALPELSGPERERLARLHFESLGCALFETALAWWAPDRRLRKWISVEGLDVLERALERGHGAILLSAHFTTLEIGARILAMHADAPGIMYQAPKDPVLARVTVQSRSGRNATAIASDNVRGLLGALKRNTPVWYAPDQREHGEDATLAPFFGLSVTTNTATSRIAAISGAPVLTYFIERRAGGMGYCVAIGGPLEDFPSGDSRVDATHMNALFEAQVRRRPEQYLWTYKRFKRPGPDGDPYRRGAHE